MRFRPSRRATTKPPQPAREALPSRTAGGAGGGDTRATKHGTRRSQRDREALPSRKAGGAGGGDTRATQHEARDARRRGSYVARDSERCIRLNPPRDSGPSPTRTRLRLACFALQEVSRQSTNVADVADELDIEQAEARALVLSRPATITGSASSQRSPEVASHRPPLAAHEGSNKITRASTPSSAATINGRTSPHASPPSPHPSAGIAID